MEGPHTILENKRKRAWDDENTQKTKNHSETKHYTKPKPEKIKREENLNANPIREIKKQPVKPKWNNVDSKEFFNKESEPQNRREKVATKRNDIKEKLNSNNPKVEEFLEKEKEFQSENTLILLSQVQVKEIWKNLDNYDYKNFEERQRRNKKDLKIKPHLGDKKSFSAIPNANLLKPIKEEGAKLRRMEEYLNSNELKIYDRSESINIAKKDLKDLKENFQKFTNATNLIYNLNKILLDIYQKAQKEKIELDINDQRLSSKLEENLIRLEENLETVLDSIYEKINLKLFKSANYQIKTLLEENFNSPKGEISEAEKLARQISLRKLCTTFNLDYEKMPENFKTNNYQNSKESPLKEKFMSILLTLPNIIDSYFLIEKKSKEIKARTQEKTSTE